MKIKRIKATLISIAGILILIGVFRFIVNYTSSSDLISAIRSNLIFISIGCILFGVCLLLIAEEKKGERNKRKTLRTISWILIGFIISATVLTNVIDFDFLFTKSNSDTLSNNELFKEFDLEDFEHNIIKFDNIHNIKLCETRTYEEAVENANYVYSIYREKKESDVYLTVFYDGENTAWMIINKYGDKAIINEETGDLLYVYIND